MTSPRARFYIPWADVPVSCAGFKKPNTSDHSISLFVRMMDVILNPCLCNVKAVISAVYAFYVGNVTK